MKNIILTDAGGQYGLGHLSRTLAIAQGLKSKGMDFNFYIRGNYNSNDLTDEFSYIRFDWINNPINVIDKIVILDSYDADKDLCKKIYQNAKKVLFIDDYNRIPYPGGFVLNSVIGAESINYPKNEKIKYLLGIKYHPLRKEFWDVPKKNINKKIKKILITFGGSDVKNKTPEILKILTNNYPNIEKKIIIGSDFININKIKKYVDEKTTLIYSPDAKKIKEEMFDCDYAISAAGQTLYELARIGVPTYAVQVADNQKNNILNWDINNVLLPEDTSYSFPNYSLRKFVSKMGRKAIDGKGVYRIYERLIND